MRSGLGAHCRAKNNFTVRLMERARAGANELIRGERKHPVQAMGILILSSGILRHQARIRTERAHLVFTIWWATAGSGRERNSRRSLDLWPCPFTPAIPRISSMANTM